MGQGDEEIVAMQQVVDAIKSLDDDTRGRVLEWAAKRFNVSITKVAGGRGMAGGVSAPGSEGQEGEFERFADLLDAANPRIEDERALVGGYWFQAVKTNQTFGAGQVNDVLKDTGEGVSNITRSLDRLQDRTPALVRQVSKSGRSKQARKTYKLTTAGIASVQRMMRGESTEEADEE